MQANIRNEIKNLSISERILLVEEIWDSIAKENGAFELTQSQKDELDRRSEAFRKNPQLGRSWEEIKSEFMQRR
ncbi:MAG: addiction module protein [Ignavibacteriales bacterium]|nr:addiction module protein [Ignavibacteriales bacterium]